jgi:hypothetical protein
MDVPRIRCSPMVALSIKVLQRIARSPPDHTRIVEKNPGAWNWRSCCQATSAPRKRGKCVRVKPDHCRNSLSLARSVLPVTNNKDDYIHFLHPTDQTDLLVQSIREITFMLDYGGLHAIDRSNSPVFRECTRKSVSGNMKTHAVEEVTLCYQQPAAIVSSQKLRKV